MTVHPAQADHACPPSVPETAMCIERPVMSLWYLGLQPATLHSVNLGPCMDSHGLTWTHMNACDLLHALHLV